MPDFDFVIRQGNLLPWLEASLLDTSAVPAEPVNLTDATAVRYVQRSYASPTPEIDRPAEFVAPRANGTVRYRWQEGDTTVEPGRRWAEWVVTFPAGDQTFPNPEHIYVELGYSVAGMPTVSEADIRSVREWVGNQVPPTDYDIALLLDSAGSVKLAALSYLSTQLAQIESGPAKWSIDGDATFDYTETIKGMRAKVRDLGASTGTATAAGGGLRVARLIRGGRER